MVFLFKTIVAIIEKQIKVQEKTKKVTSLRILWHCVLLCEGGQRGPEASAVSGDRGVEKFGKPWP